MIKVAGNFGFNGWSESVEERLKAILTNYRCSNANQSILYRGLVTLGKAYNEANHDPELYAKTIKSHLSTICLDCFEQATVETFVKDHGNSTYSIEIAVTVMEKGKRYDLHTILKSNEKNLFDEYEKTYFEFKF